MERLAIALLALWLVGCALPAQDREPLPLAEIDTSDARAAFESQGFRLKRALDWESTALSHICVTRYFEIHFAEQHTWAAFELARQADPLYEAMSGWLSFHLVRPVHVSILPQTPQDVRYTAKSRLPGMTQSRHGRIVLMPEDTADTTRFAHRLAKLFLRRVVHQQPVPWWFMTGMAGYLANHDQLNPIFKRQVAQETIQSGVLTWNPMAQTGAEGEHPSEMVMASLSVLIFLADTYGEDRLRKLLTTYSREFFRGTFREHLEEQYKPQSELESEWHTYLRKYAPPGLEGLQIETLPEQN